MRFSTLAGGSVFLKIPSIVTRTRGDTTIVSTPQAGSPGESWYFCGPFHGLSPAQEDSPLTSTRFVRLRSVALLLAVIWCVHVYNLLTGYSLNQWGIVPRTLSGLIGIPLAPFLHASTGHILGNTPPLAGLAALIVLIRGTAPLLALCAFVTVVAGLGVWLTGQTASHVGASGLIMGLWAYCLAYAYFRRSFLALVLGAVAVIIYGGLLSSLFSFAPHISISYHVWGFVAGGLYGYLDRVTPAARSVTTTGKA